MVRVVTLGPWCGGFKRLRMGFAPSFPCLYGVKNIQFRHPLPSWSKNNADVYIGVHRLPQSHASLFLRCIL